MIACLCFDAQTASQALINIGPASHTHMGGDTELFTAGRIRGRFCVNYSRLRLRPARRW